MPCVERNIKANPYFKDCSLEKITSLLNAYAMEFGINTPRRWAHYLSQIAHESAELRYSKEIASGAAYDTGKLAKQLGNTPEKDGDGQFFKGRGLIQLTGRANYEAYKKYCGFDVVKDPELLAKPVGAIRSSMWFWRNRGLNELAEKDNFKEITRRINGGFNHLKERAAYLERAKQTFNI